MTAHPGPVIAERDGLRVVDCRACGYAHLNPLPDPAALDAYYRTDFWATKGAGWRERYEAERDWLDMRHGDWLSVLETHTLGRTLLDVGCGYGHFLAAAQGRGWYVVGIDPSEEAAQYATVEKMVHVAPVAWTSVEWPLYFDDGCPIKYDALSALWLAEHLPNPLDFLRWCYAHTYAAGALLLAVPNEWNFYQASAIELGRCIPDFFVHPTHANYWDKGTLGNLLGRAGWRVVDWSATWPIEFELIQGSDYTRDERIGDAVHAEIRAAELSMTRAERLERGRMLARQSVGRDLVVVCVKENP